MSSNNLPDKSELPFFAYGLFKPDQLAYWCIKDFVDENETDSKAWTEGVILERDGLPILKPGPEGSAPGVLLTFHEGCEEEAYSNIAALESKYQYRRETLPIEHSAGSITANALAGKRPDRGSL